MKSLKGQLVKVFGLPVTATDGQVIEAARQAQEAASAKQNVDEEAEIVRQIIADSCGALTERQARQVIKDRAQYQISTKTRKEIGL